MDGSIGAGGPDVPTGDGPPSGERRKLNLVPRSKPMNVTTTPGSGPAPAPASAKKASIFGGGKPHDEFAYEVRGRGDLGNIQSLIFPRAYVAPQGGKGRCMVGTVLCAVQDPGQFCVVVLEVLLCLGRRP